MKSYSEMMKHSTYGDRLHYLNLSDTRHTSPRSISEKFYKTYAWKEARKQAIKRDMGCDLGVIDQDISGQMLVHHINPIDEDDIRRNDPKLLDPENLITTSLGTHNKIHYGIPIEVEVVERKAGDTKLW